MEPAPKALAKFRESERKREEAKRARSLELQSAGGGGDVARDASGVQVQAQSV